MSFLLKKSSIVLSIPGVSSNAIISWGTTLSIILMMVLFRILIISSVVLFKKALPHSKECKTLLIQFQTIPTVSKCPCALIHELQNMFYIYKLNLITPLSTTLFVKKSEFRIYRRQIRLYLLIRSFFLSWVEREAK